MNRKQELIILISNVITQIHNEATKDYYSTDVDDLNYMMQQVDKLSTILKTYQLEFNNLK